MLPVFLFAIHFYSLGQNLTRERLNSLKMDHSVLFRLEKIESRKRLTYEIDPRDVVLKEKNTSRSKVLSDEVKNEEKLHLASTGTSFNILFEFLNPLKYSYKIESREKADPSSLALEKFYGSLFDLAKKINYNLDGNGTQKESVSTAINRLYELNNFYDPWLYDQTTQSQNRQSKQLDLNLVRLKSNELIDWVLWYYQTYYDRGKIKGVRYTIVNGVEQPETPMVSNLIYINNLSNMDSLIRKFLLAEKYLYQRLNEGLTSDLTGDKKKKLFFEAFLVDMFEEIGNANTASDFTNSLKKVKDNLAKLQSYNDEAEELCKQIEGITLNSKIDAIKTITNPVEEIYFVAYTQDKRSSYLQKVRSVISTRTSLINKFNDLIKSIEDKFTPSIAAKNVTKVSVQTTEPGSMKEIDIELIENNYVIENGTLKKNEDNVYDFKLVVTEYTSMVAEFGLGAIFFPTIDINSYSISDGSIVKTTSKMYFSPMASLNLVPNIGKGPVFWMLQLGVGSNMNAPTIAAGTGFRVYSVQQNAFKNFSLTFGLVGSFTKKLNNLSEGALVSQAQLDSDVFFSPEFRPYVGLQLNF